MKALEDRTKPLLRSLLRGERLSLDTPNQATLATWATKTAMMLTLRFTKAPSEVLRRTLYERQQPPSNTGVWLSSVQPETLRVGTLPLLSQPYGDPPEPDRGFMARLIFANIGFIVFFNPTRYGLQLNGNHVAETFHQIWPADITPWDWPPAHSVRPSDLDDMARNIVHLLSLGQPLPEAPPHHVFPGSEALIRHPEGGSKGDPPSASE
jgi:hypothetical protein